MTPTGWDPRTGEVLARDGRAMIRLVTATRPVRAVLDPELRAERIGGGLRLTVPWLPGAFAVVGPDSVVSGVTDDGQPFAVSLLDLVEDAGVTG